MNRADTNPVCITSLPFLPKPPTCLTSGVRQERKGKGVEKFIYLEELAVSWELALRWSIFKADSTSHKNAQVKTWLLSVVSRDSMCLGGISGAF